MSRVSRSAYSVTASRLDSRAPAGRRVLRMDKAVARECLPSAVAARGQNNSASRSRLCERPDSTAKYTRRARCFFVRKRIGSPLGAKRAGWPKQRRECLGSIGAHLPREASILCGSFN
jgi:hypothetical protein